MPALVDNSRCCAQLTQLHTTLVQRLSTLNRVAQESTNQFNIQARTLVHWVDMQLQRICSVLQAALDARRQRVGAAKCAHEQLNPLAHYQYLHDHTTDTVIYTCLSPAIITENCVHVGPLAER